AGGTAIGCGRMTARSRRPRLALADGRAKLEELYRTFDHVTSATDPVHIVRRYAARDDREVVGFCAASLAFGRVASVLHSIEALLAAMGPRPAAFVRQFQPARDRAAIDPLVHRWIRGRDLVALILVLQRMLREHGSIEAFFAAGTTPRRATSAPLSTRSPHARSRRTCAAPTARSDRRGQA